MPTPVSKISAPTAAWFESNFPVDKGACSYPVLFNAFKRLASGASASEKADLSPAPHHGFTGWGND